MQIKTELARSIDRTKEEIAYDESVKRILSTKHLLAWIMKGCVAEYKNYCVEYIVDNYIEGDPEVSKTPVHRGDVIQGLDTADKDISEHTTLYDVLFYATLPDSDEKIGLFINIEAQNKFNPGYPLIKRGIYYCSRLISSQFEKDFADGHYENLKKVYSIWICANAPDSRNNTVTQYELTEKYLLGEAKEERINYDLLSVIMICFNDKNLDINGNNESDSDSADLVRLLNILLSSKIGSNDKKQILLSEYNIPMTRELESEVLVMCNLSSGIKEQGAFDKAKKVSIELMKMGISAENIIRATELSMDQLKQIADDNNLEIVK